MGKFIYFLLGLTSLIAPLVYAMNAANKLYTKSFWEFYPLFISGVLLALVFFYLSGRNSR